MGNRIIICGGNGSGKSTLGKTLAQALNIKFMDVEDYYFPVIDSIYKYSVCRSKEEVCDLLYVDMQNSEDWIFAAVKGNYGEKIEALFTCAILIDVPKDIRLQRVRERSFLQFGNRMLPNGDLYENEQQFFDMVEKRTNEDVEKWVEWLDCPIVRIDGMKPVKDNTELLIKMLFHH